MENHIDWNKMINPDMEAIAKRDAFLSDENGEKLLASLAPLTRDKLLKLQRRTNEMKNNLIPPKYLMLTLCDDGTYNIDFFDKKESATGWQTFEMKKNETHDRKVNCIIYEPIKED